MTELRLKWISYHKYANAIRYSMCWLEAAKEHCKANKWNSHLIERWNVPITANHLIQLRMHQNHWLHHSQAIYLRPEWRITRNFVFAWNYCIKCWNSWEYSFLRLHLSGFAWIWLILRCKRFDVCFRISIYPVNQTVLRRVSNVMNFDKCVSEKCRRKENEKRKSNNVSYLKYTEYMRIKRDYTTNANQIEAHGVYERILHTQLSHAYVRTYTHTHKQTKTHTHTKLKRERKHMHIHAASLATHIKINLALKLCEPHEPSRDKSHRTLGSTFRLKRIYCIECIKDIDYFLRMQLTTKTT